MPRFQGRSFSKRVVGAEPVKSAQSAIKIHEFHYFFPDLTHFLAQVVGVLAQAVGAQAHTTEYETTPLLSLMSHGHFFEIVS